jgi:23S rRNA (uridine2552-2'-O)-methyltransferase
MVFSLPRKRDMYTKKAKSEGYRSRAAYKLLQIDKKFKLFHSNQTVIDLCGAPGGFSQIARDRSHDKALIFIVDIARIKPIPNVTDIIKGDITKFQTILKVKESIENHNAENRDTIVLADCSPNVSGHWITDHTRQIWLAEAALGISKYFLATKFVTKVFQGEYYQDFFIKVNDSYRDVKAYKPPTSRKESAEIYIIAINNKCSERYNRLYLIKSD